VVQGIDFDPDAIYLQFGDAVAPGGYAWIFPKGVGIANVGLGLVALKSDGRNARQYLDAWMDRRYPNGARTGYTVGGVIVHTTVQQTYADGLLVAGDAAHMINPLSGGGIVNAMKAGRLAGCTVAAAIRAGDTSARRLAAYHHAWMELLGQDHVKYYRIKRALESVDDAFFNALARTVNAIPPERRTLGRIFAHALVQHPQLIAEAPDDVRANKRYKDVGDFSIAGLAERLTQDFGARSLDIVVHSLANGPEVKKPLLETSRAGYLTAVSVSAYSLVSLVARLGPLLRPGGSFLSLTYLASERVVPGYGGGMSSAKAALESDTRTLAFEAGRKYGARVNTISAGPLASRAASAIGKIEQMVQYYSANAPLTEPLSAWEVGTTAAFLASPLASGITGATIYVDKGYHAMGMAVGAGNLL